CVMFYLARRAFLLFFYLLLLRSPLPTLFPYTTLFRSTALVLYGQNAKGFLKNAAWLLVFTYGLTFLVFLLLLAPAGAIVYFMPGDRKSTRLNSSHVSISYAVFCLKKKN